MATLGRNAFAVTFDLNGPATALADRIDSLSSKALVRLSAVDAVNEVATRFEATARKAMNAGLNLSDQYVADRMSLQRAAGTPRAEIVARGDLTILGRYPNAQLTTAARGKSRGDASRGIPAGRKAAGVAVEIRRGQAQAVDQWFTMRLRTGAQAGDKVGVFYRTGAGPLKHIYGPSPYSLFRYQINTNTDELTADLERTATARASAAVLKALA